MLTKTKNIRKKIPPKKCLNAKTPERMAQGKQQPKFERNPYIRFRDNCATDGWTTDEFDFMNSADIVNQS